MNNGSAAQDDQGKTRLNLYIMTRRRRKLVLPRDRTPYRVRRGAAESGAGRGIADAQPDIRGVPVCAEYGSQSTREVLGRG